MSIARKLTLKFFREQGAIGGHTSAQRLTKEQRIARAKKAVAAREAKRVIKNSLRSPSDGDIVNPDTCHESPAVDQKRARS